MADIELKKDLEDMVCEGLILRRQALDMVYWQAFVNTVVNFWVP
jgi:hypothetical protein